MADKDITIEPVVGNANRYQAVCGNRKLTFDVSENFNVTIVNDEGGKKPLIFYGSKPMVMLTIGRMLKHISGFAIGLKNEAGAK